MPRLAPALRGAAPEQRLVQRGGRGQLQAQLVGRRGRQRGRRRPRRRQDRLQRASNLLRARPRR